MSSPTTSPAYGTISATVTAAATILEIPTRGRDVLFLSAVVGVANLSAFTVEYRVASGGGYFTVASSAGNYTTPNAPVLQASGDLTVAAFGATVHWLKLDVRGVESVRVKAAGTASTVTGHWGAT